MEVIREGDILQHEYWGDILDQIADGVKTLYESKVPLPNPLWARKGRQYEYTENDPARQLVTPIAEFELRIDKNFICNSTHEHLHAVVKGSQGKIVLEFGFGHMIKYNRGIIVGYELLPDEYQRWNLVLLDTDNIALLPIILQALRREVSVDKDMQQDDKIHKQNYLDAIAELSAQYF